MLGEPAGVTAAAAAAAPPDEPPVVRSKSQGLRVTPHKSPWQTALWPNSDVVVLPRMTAPASRSRLTHGESAVSPAGIAVLREPRRNGKPAAEIRSLIVTGMPSRGPSSRPCIQRASDRRAASIAPSKSSSQNALRRGS
jgi:hypothetical protein